MALIALLLVFVPVQAVVSGPTGQAATTPSASATGSAAVATAHPVDPVVREIPLSGVDAAALRADRASVLPAGPAAPGAVAKSATSAPAVLTAALRTAAFQTVGVTWTDRAAAPDLLISVRTRTGGAWSGWGPLDDDAGDDLAAHPAVPAGTSGATGMVVRGGTDPLWVGPSDGVQVRVVVRSGELPAGLRLALVDPSASDYDTAVLADPTAGAPAGAAFSAASAGKPAVYTRAQWGANEQRVACAPTMMSTVRAAVMHHTAGKNNYAASAVPSIIRGDYAYHLSRGWCDIGYNALVDRFGRIWEGRAGGLDRAVMGAHAGGFNNDTFGVSVIGNYDVSRPSSAAVSAVARVMAWKLDLYHRDPGGTTRLTSAGGGTARWSSGRTVTLPVIMGHRNTGSTACPGRYLYPYLPSIRTKVRALMKAALLDPAGAPPSVLRGQPMSITARALFAQSWRLNVTSTTGGGRVARINGSVKAGRVITATWSGRLADGTPARPGRYRLTLTSSSATGTARPVVDDVLVVPPVPAPEVPATPSGGQGGYVPVTPTRLLDTRTGGRIGLGPNGRVDVPVLGRAGVPTSGVTAVVLNLTASGTDDTSLSAWPTGRSTKRPLTVVPAGLTRSAMVTSRVGGGGSVSVGSSQGVTELMVDVVGYFTPYGGLLQPVTSTRIFDSRNDAAGPATGDPRLVPLPATLAGRPPAQIAAVVVDVSALSPAGAGGLVAYRPGEAGDLLTVTYRKGESVDNLAVVPVVDGAIALKATGPPVDAVLDVRAVVLSGPSTGPEPGGYRFTAIKPTLLLDDTGVGAGTTRKVVVTGPGTGVPAGAAAVLVDLTLVGPTATTWLEAYPWGTSPAGGVGVRVEKGDTRGNLTMVPVGPGGAITVGNARGSTRIRIDVHGYLS